MTCLDMVCLQLIVSHSIHAPLLKPSHTDVFVHMPEEALSSRASPLALARDTLSGGRSRLRASWLRDDEPGNGRTRFRWAGFRPSPACQHPW